MSSLPKGLDIEMPDLLIGYLRQSGHIEQFELPIITLLTGGVSNRTVMVQRENGEAWVIKQALDKLRVAVDWFSSPERVHREAAGLRTLAQLLPQGVVPQLLFEDHDVHLLGMEAVAQPHENWKSVLLAGDLHTDHIRQFGEILGTIHREATLRHRELAPLFNDRTFFESLRLEPYYAYTASQVPDAAPFLDALIAATRQRPLTLVHGDYSPKNTLLYQDRLILLDFEVIHWGDPAFDLGFSMTHLLSKAHYLRSSRQRFVDGVRTYWQAYQMTLGDIGWNVDVEEWAVKHTLACLLARVAGRSPLEYFSTEERRIQQDVVISLLQEPIKTFEQLATEFISAVVDATMTKSKIR